MHTILVAHNFYQQAGGEDQVFAAEAALLERHGHEVVRFTEHNDRIAAMTPVAVAAATMWNRRVQRELAATARRSGARIAHFHNIFPLMSPAVYYAARDAGCAIVQTVHNFRLMCLAGFMEYDGHICEACVDKRFAWPGVLRGCYRGSRAASAVAATMFTAHGALGTWRDLPDVYIALSEFARNKLARHGLPRERIVVKPHFLDPDPGAADGAGDYALFVGRLAPEKGVTTLLDAWERHNPGLRLVIVGDGPLAGAVAAAAERRPDIDWLGWRPRAEVMPIIGDARVLIVPSLGYEAFGLVILEAMAQGTPVIASRQGPLVELIEEDRTGWMFGIGDAAALAERVGRVAARPGAVRAMRAEVRARFLERYTAERNYDMSMAVYERALARATGRAAA